MWRFRKKGLCIFMYHHVGPLDGINDECYYIAPDLFSKQMSFLLENGYQPLSLWEVQEAFELKRKLPEKPVLITLDDGWLDNYVHAYPILKEKNIPATIFLTPGLIGTDKHLLSWAQISEMHESGLIQFASHGYTHKRLRDLSNEEVLFELKESKKALEEFYKQPVKSFCYPFGAFDRRVRRLVFEAGYTLDYGTRKGINAWPWSQNRPLLRAHVMANESLENFSNELKYGRK